MANPQKKIVKAGPSVTTPSVEGKVVEYVDSEHILDPNDPRAVQVPEAWKDGFDNPLDQHLEQSPNEVSGDEPAQFINPHTGENVNDATTPSPVPDNVVQAEKIEDVEVPGEGEDTALTGDELADAKADADVVEAAPADTPADDKSKPADKKSK